MINPVFSAECDGCHQQYWVAAENKEAAAKRVATEASWLFLSDLCLCVDCRKLPNYWEVIRAWNELQAVRKD